MTAQTSMLHVRVDDETKTKANAALNAMGLTMSDAVRLLLHRVVADQAFPLELKVPNTQTRAAMTEADEIAGKHRNRFAEAETLFEDLEANGKK